MLGNCFFLRPISGTHCVELNNKQMRSVRNILDQSRNKVSSRRRMKRARRTSRMRQIYKSTKIEDDVEEHTKDRKVENGKEEE
uniref:Uncharacterized protein n=1 Tax=Arion vulgaris TaxID=1028688 RepID=A0A0B6ZQ85_9EUPU